MLLRPPRYTRPYTSFPTRRSSDLPVALRNDAEKAAALWKPQFPATTLIMASSFASSNLAWLMRAFDMNSLSVIPTVFLNVRIRRSEEHTSELQSLMRISYAVFCLKKKNTNEDYQNKQQFEI